jgi:hypothetical protein
MSDPRCGTSAGYMAHRYANEAVCDDCVKGHAAQIAAHRAQHGRHDRPLSKARTRAHTRLAREYPDRFRVLYEQAKAEVFAEEWAQANGGAR